MKQFVVLLCLSSALLVAAAPQGYKYQAPALSVGNLRPQTPISNNGIYNLGHVEQSAPISTIVSNVGTAPISTLVNTVVTPQVQQVQHVQQHVQQVQPQPIVYQQQHQHQQQFVQTVQQPQQQFVPQQPQQQLIQTQYVQRPSIVTKDIYIHSAPDDTEELVQSAPQLDNVPIRKNYRIVFIKAPTQNLKHTAAALKRAQATNEEKTVIYVLSKKPDIAEIQQHLQVTQTENKVHKPEVYFIKYKTTEEAQRAQQEIQAQYDALGGATHISDEGVAPITSFTSGGSLNLNNILPQNIQTQTVHQNQGHNIVQTAQRGEALLSQPIQQQNSFTQHSSTISSSSNFGVNQPSRKYIPAKAF